MTKPIVKICYKLLYVIQGVDEITSWPQLISKLLVACICLLHAASDWPRTFFTPKVFLFSILPLFVNKQMVLSSMKLNSEKTTVFLTFTTE